MNSFTARGCAAAFLLILPLATARADVLESLRVPPGFSIELAAGPELTSYPMFMEFDDAGRMYIAESTGKDLSGKEMAAAPECTILRLVDADGDGTFDSRTVFADTLSLPMGVLWHEGALYVASPPDFIRFEDTDDDGKADKREVLLTGWNVLNTASLHGPFLGPDGWLYLTHGRHGYKIATKEGELLEGLAARIWRCRPDGTGLERVLGGGFDNPVELIFTNAGEMIGTMTYFTDPRQGQRDALMHWIEGGVYPKPHGEALAEFVRTGDLMPTMTKFARIAPAGLMRYRGTHFGPEYEDILFSAQFNPHRVQRHKLFREGATFRTEDEDFLTSSNPDFYPTDVIEDADGSLLVSDTGAWYVDACPISRVAKPEVRGGLYRIRKDGGATPGDPWGRDVKWDAQSAEALVKWLSDERPRVQDAAFSELANSGNGAVGELIKGALGKSTGAAQAKAVWALSRIETPRARKGVRSALGADNPEVIIAAAHAIGLAGDDEALPALRKLIGHADPAVRREAATALGRFKDAGAAPALLAACGGASDRFEEHALIYAAIMSGNATAAESLLDDAAVAPKARKAALIALDQMAGSRLTEERFAGILDDADPEVRRMAMWVASRHSDWAATVVNHIAAALKEWGTEPAARAGLRELLYAYAGDGAVQAAVADSLGDQAAPVEKQLYLMDLIATAPIAELPDSWTGAVARQLGSTDMAIRWKAVETARARGIAAVTERLSAIADDSNEPAAFRVAALSAILPGIKQLPDARFALLASGVHSDADPGLRQSAAKALGSAPLDPNQRLRLATEILPGADALTLPLMLRAFEGVSDEPTGLALVKALSSVPAAVDLLAQDRLDAVLKACPPAVLAAAMPLRERAEADAKARLEKLAQVEPLLATGDVTRGRRIFFGETVACSTCHAVGNEGGTLGPDLTTVGAVRSAHDLLEAVLFPNASILQDYEPYVIETADNQYSGVVGSETPEAITLNTGVGESVRIPRAEIASMTRSAVSIMPEALDTGLSQQDLVDLITFLRSLNNEQWLLPEQRENAAKAGH